MAHQRCQHRAADHNRGRRIGLAHATLQRHATESQRRSNQRPCLASVEHLPRYECERITADKGAETGTFVYLVEES